MVPPFLHCTYNNTIKTICQHTGRSFPMCHCNYCSKQHPAIFCCHRGYPSSAPLHIMSIQARLHNTRTPCTQLLHSRHTHTPTSISAVWTLLPSMPEPSNPFTRNTPIVTVVSSCIQLTDISEESDSDSQGPGKDHPGIVTLGKYKYTQSFTVCCTICHWHSAINHMDIVLNDGFRGRLLYGKCCILTLCSQDQLLTTNHSGDQTGAVSGPATPEHGCTCLYAYMLVG